MAFKITGFLKSKKQKLAEKESKTLKPMIARRKEQSAAIRKMHKNIAQSPGGGTRAAEGLAIRGSTNPFQQAASAQFSKDPKKRAQAGKLKVR